MSSMRSASSSTTYSTWFSTQFLASMWSSRRPGVATSTSTPRLQLERLRLHVDAAEDHRDAQLGVLGVALDVGGDLVGQLARRREHQRAHRVARRRHAGVLVLAASAAAAAARTRRSCRCRSAPRPSRRGRPARSGSPWPGSASSSCSPGRRRRAAGLGARPTRGEFERRMGGFSAGGGGRDRLRARPATSIDSFMRNYRACASRVAAAMAPGIRAVVHRYTRRSAFDTPFTARAPMILVTGGAGFIGANFVLDWLAAQRRAASSTSTS